MQKLNIGGFALDKTNQSPRTVCKAILRRLISAVLILLLIAMFIPSAIALGNDSPSVGGYYDPNHGIVQEQVQYHGEKYYEGMSF